MTTADTIAAISTPAGEGAIALIRMSGAAAIGVADKIFRGKARPSQFVSHMQHLGEIVDSAGHRVDQVVLAVHRTPASYTGEDLVEISCHGGTLITAKVLEACLRGGARAARPGEFTERAFLNRKMDLTQAEAVIDLIRARTDLALRSAAEQLEGRLGQRIRMIQDALIAIVAQIEASIDFPEEGINPHSPGELRQRLGSVGGEISGLLATADQGRIVREGVRVVIYGPTNAGKSSLLNRMVGHERVIVSEIPGTTRDLVEETINLRGIPVRLVDTAGLCNSSDDIELQGILRTEKSLRTADVRLHMADRTAPRPADFNGKSGESAEILILNKCDLPEHNDWKDVDGLRLSCLTGEGLGRFEEELLGRITKGNLGPDNVLAINTRHRDCLRRALESCQAADAALERSVPLEYVTIDLNAAMRAIGEVTGEVDVEDILDSVFGQFCIGK